jgi:hypothetical protein
MQSELSDDEWGHCAIVAGAKEQKRLRKFLGKNIAHV